MSDIGFGFLGSGNMATVYADALATQVSGGRFVAVAGGTRAESLASAYGAQAEPDVDALLARSDVDVVVIATPHSTHLDLALRTAAAGKHIYLEKPMALDTAECTAIIDAARTAGVQLTVAKQTRHGDPEMLAKQLIDDGVIGDVRYIRPMSPTIGAGFAQGNHWSSDPKEGKAFLDWGCHCCDAIRWLTGSEAVRVAAEYQQFGAHAEAPDPTALVQFRLASGALGQIFMCYEVPPPGYGTNSNNQYSIIGSKGIIEFDLDHLRLGDADGWKTLLELPTWINPLQPHNPRRIKRSALQVQGFIDALRDGRRPPITGEDGRAAVEMTEAATRSAETGQVVTLPLERVAA
jgi:myo-inositol 2-dehydrogenase/D-chiro-inositol 1-dehydrogenase